MPETLLTPSSILLYGRVMIDLQLVQQAPNPNPPPPPPPPGTIPTHPQGLGSNEFLRDQLAGQGPGRPAPTLARIYAFSYEGSFYVLPKPAIFLVHGPGTSVDTVKPPQRAARAPAGVDRTGVAAQDYEFSDDIMLWSYDKGDFSIRMDIETGPFEQILLEAMLMAEGSGTGYSGAQAQIGGAQARLSGAQARLSGAQARIRNRGGSWSD